MPEISDIQLYNTEYGRAQAREIPVEYKTKVMEWLEPGQDDRVLEIGSGGGDMLPYLRNKGFTKVYGLDINPSVLRDLGATDSVAARAQAIPIQEDSIDKSVSIHTLEHLQDLPTVFQELDRVTKAGGLSFHAFPAPMLTKMEGAIEDVIRMKFAEFKKGFSFPKLWQALKESWKIANQLHPHKLNPDKVKGYFKDTGWELLKAEKIFVPTEKGFSWLVLLKKGQAPPTTSPPPPAVQK